MKLLDAHSHQLSQNTNRLMFKRRDQIEMNWEMRFIFPTSLLRC